MKHKVYQCYKYISLFCALGCIVSCASTNLDQAPLSLNDFQLAASSKETICLTTKLMEGAELGGNQYALIGLPLGEVGISEPEYAVRNGIYRALSFANIKPILEVPCKDSSLGTLEVEVRELSISAYDYLFTRKLVAETSFRLTHADPRRPIPKTIVAHGEFVQWKSTGFAPELKRALAKSIAQAADDALKKLFPGHHSSP